MSLYSKPRRERISGSIGPHLGGIDVDFFAPDQARLLALLDNGFKEATEDLNHIARAYLRQAGMIRQWFSQVIAEVPQDAESISRMPHEQSFGADILKEHHELQFEKHDGINRRAADHSIGLLHQFAHEREVERFFYVPIEMIVWHQLFQ